MANMVFRELGSTVFTGGNEIWFRQNEAGVIVNTEFFGVTAPVGTEGYINAWTGSAWALKPVKVWTGSAWVQKPVKFWNGTSWALA